MPVNLVSLYAHIADCSEWQERFSVLISTSKCVLYEYTGSLTMILSLGYRVGDV